MPINKEIKTYFKSNRERHIQEYMNLLSIPSVSALPEHQEDMKKIVDTLVDYLRTAGMNDIQVIPTEGQPIVYASYIQDPNKPTVLIYGHYDVQPADPFELWDTPPFEPVLKDNIMYARGAADNKGQFFMHIKAVEALIKTGNLPLNIKFCIEGEEEIGSPSFEGFILENEELLYSDVLLISDGPLFDKGIPAICYGLKGLVSIQLDLKGPNEDLHSGLYGGMVNNPLHAMSHVLSSFFDESGAIGIKGFYDKVLPLTKKEKEEFNKVPFSEEDILKETGSPSLFGEKDYSTLERNWARPTLDINGMWGGFQGYGSKTIIPSTAHAKITCRIVNNQDPEEIISLIEKHVEKYTPESVVVEIKKFGEAMPYLSPPNHPTIEAAAVSYRETYGVDPVYTRSGGSIPVVETFHRQLKLPVVLMGFGDPDAKVHAPNENFHLRDFDTGLETISKCYEEFSKMDKKSFQLEYE